MRVGLFFFEGGCLGVDAYVDGWMEGKMFLWFRECVCILWRESWVEILFLLRMAEGYWLWTTVCFHPYSVGIWPTVGSLLYTFKKPPPPSLSLSSSFRLDYPFRIARLDHAVGLPSSPWRALTRTTIAFVFSNTQVGEMHVSTKLDCQLASYYRSNFKSSTLRSIRFVLLNLTSPCSKFGN